MFLHVWSIDELERDEDRDECSVHHVVVIRSTPSLGLKC